MRKKHNIRMAGILLAAAAMTALTGCQLTKVEPNGVEKKVESTVPKAESEAPKTESAVSSAAQTVSDVESAAESLASSIESAVVVESVAEIPESVAESVPEEVEETTAVLSDDELRVLGEEKPVSEYVSKTRIGNASDQKIVNLAIRLRSDGYDSNTYLSEEDPMEPSERVMLYFDGEKGLKEAEEGGDIAEFQVSVLYEDGFFWRLGKFPFGKTDEVTIMRGDGYAYMIYTLKEDGTVVNTENTERAKLGLDEKSETESSDPAADYDYGQDGSSSDEESSDSSEDEQESSGSSDDEQEDGGSDTSDGEGDDEGADEDDGGDVYFDENAPEVDQSEEGFEGGDDVVG